MSKSIKASLYKWSITRGPFNAVVVAGYRQGIHDFWRATLFSTHNIGQLLHLNSRKCKAYTDRGTIHLKGQGVIDAH